MKILIKIVNYLSCFLLQAGIFSIIILGTIMVINLLLRRFNLDFLGIFQLSELVLSASVFFAFAYTWSVDGHVRVELCIDHLKGGLRTFSELISCLFGIILFTSITIANINMAIDSFLNNETTQVGGFYIYPVYIAIIIGSFLMIIQLIISMILFIKSPER